MAIPAIAFFDALSIVAYLDRSAGGATDGEVSAFAYLACLLSTYAGNSPASWGYGFAATGAGAPVSATIAGALDEMRRSGLIEVSASSNRLATRGSAELAMWSELAYLSGRSDYLRGACGTALVLPTALVTDALSLEPQLLAAARLDSTRPLLDESGELLLRPHFDQLRAAIGETHDSMVPAVIWLRLLADMRLRFVA